MSLVKATASGENYLRKFNTTADKGYVSNMSMFEKKLGSDGIANKLFYLSGPYVVGSRTLLIFVNGQLAEAVDTLPADPVQNLLYKEVDEFTVQFDVALLNEDVLTFMVVGTTQPPLGEGNLVPLILSATGTTAEAGYRLFVDTTGYTDISPLIINMPINPVFGSTVGICDLTSNFHLSRLRINSIYRIMHSSVYPDEYTMDVTTMNASFKLVFTNSTWGWRTI